MHFELLWWAVSIGIAWLILTAFVPLDDWIKSLFGRKSTIQTLEQRIAALEARMEDSQKRCHAAPESNPPDAASLPTP
jgi:hypothetical protein